MSSLDTFWSPLTSLEGDFWCWPLSWETTTSDYSVRLLYFVSGSVTLSGFSYLPRQKQWPHTDKQTFLSQFTRRGASNDLWHQPKSRNSRWPPRPAIQSNLLDVGYCFALDFADHLYLVSAGGISDLFAFGRYFWDGIANAKVSKRYVRAVRAAFDKM